MTPQPRPALLLWVALALLLSAGDAQPPAPALPAPGLYEVWSPVTMAPAGPMVAAQARKLPRWVEVAVAGTTATLTFQPEGRVVWEVAYGPHGPLSKETRVDGERWTLSTFRYDAKGHLQAKEVTGPGIDARTKAPALRYAYTTDAQGRVQERRRLTPGAQAPPVEGWTLTRSPDGAITAETRANGTLQRTDHYDAHGLPTRATLHGAASGPMELLWRRRANGELLGIEWVLGGKRGSAMPIKPGARAEPLHLRALVGMPVERHEVLLLLGDPPTHSDDGRGEARAISDDYAPSCWLNQLSTLRYDPSGLLAGGDTACICGFCVDAALPFEATDIDGIDLHWTEGPWVRLDGEVDVTADHRLLTPTGPRAAGELEAGDVVLDGRGRPRTLRRVEALPPGGLRLGRNVRTRSGAFAVGGFLFESETGRPCPAP